ncbi:MAG: dTMP kinase [Acidobacteriota bacterium]|nr:dTMP kinase [Acidobacteriota bacterium]
MGKRGIFITFEGIDGCGKTTQLRLLGEKLRHHGSEVVETIEPGGTAIGQQIRRILLDSANGDLKPTSELLLYFASRAQNVEEVIRPALESGRFVLCDRFTDSTLVYQGCGRGLPAETVLTLDHIACAGLLPDRTVLIDVDLETSLSRARRRNQIDASVETRIDEESFDFHKRVRDGYLALAERERARFLVIDGRAKIGMVAERVWEAIQPDV